MGDRERLRAELDEPFRLTEAQARQYQEQGFIKLKQVLSPAVLELYGREVTREVLRRSRDVRPLDERDTYGKAFLQVSNVWPDNEVAREFAFSRRLARLAAELMGVAGVRMYHDQALYKEPGGGLTPWHVDQYYWPLDTNNTCTVWVPLQATPLEMGPLAFSAGSQRYNLGRDLGISDTSEKKISKAVLETGLPLIETAYDLGEISFHGGWTFHRAGGNNSSEPRRVMTVIYMDADARVKTPSNKNQQADWDTWLPGVPLGEVAASPLNPVLYRAV